jgi:DNA-directed RNA polymerase subunit M/transcription elongation factor TFIIS
LKDHADWYIHLHEQREVRCEATSADMKFCPVCDRCMVNDAAASEATWVCPSCKKKVPAEKWDLLVSTEIIMTEGSDNAMYDTIIRTSAHDPTCQQVMRDCAKCGRDYMTQIRIGEEERVLFTCPCGNKTDNAGKELTISNTSKYAEDSPKLAAVEGAVKPAAVGGAVEPAVMGGAAAMKCAPTKDAEATEKTLAQIKSFKVNIEKKGDVIKVSSANTPLEKVWAILKTVQMETGLNANSPLNAIAGFKVYDYNPCKDNALAAMACDAVIAYHCKNGDTAAASQGPRSAILLGPAGAGSVDVALCRSDSWFGGVQNLLPAVKKEGLVKKGGRIIVFPGNHALPPPQAKILFGTTSSANVYII